MTSPKLDAVLYAVGINDSNGRLSVGIAHKSVRNVELEDHRHRSNDRHSCRMIHHSYLFPIRCCLWRDKLSFEHLSLEHLVPVILRTEYDKLGHGIIFVSME